MINSTKHIKTYLKKLRRKLYYQGKLNKFQTDSKKHGLILKK